MSTRLPDKMILHRMGYYSNQEGIARRYIQEDDNWNIHLSNTRRFILNIVRKERPETVTVLGSGWLLDIPMQEIIRTGCRVRLVDLVHPPGVVDQLGGETSVSFEHEDITGGLPEMVWMMASEKPVPDTDQILQRIAALRYEPPVNPGLVLSVNLLSQLATLPFEFLQKKKIVTQDFFCAFTAAIQEKHLVFLKKNNAVLVTDFAELHRDRSGAVQREEIVGCHLPAGRKREEWLWEFDTGGNYKQGFKTSMQVVALHI